MTQTAGRLIRALVIGLFAVAAVATMGPTAAAGGHGQASAEQVTGLWQLSVMHDHAIPFGLELTQDGTTVTGTISTPATHGGRGERIQVNGTFVDRNLTLASAGDDQDSVRIRLTGTLKDDGTMEGTVTGSKMGTRTWTAERMGRIRG